MKISFWSNMHGQPRTTSNMIAAAVIMSAKYKAKIALLQSHFMKNNIGLPLLGSELSMDVFSDTGIDALVRDIKSKPLTEDVITDESISLTKTGTPINLFLGTSKKNQELFDQEMKATFGEIMSDINKYHEFVLIDTNSGRNELSMDIIEKSNLVVINFSQSIPMMDEYFSEPIEHDNIIYVIGNYDNSSKYNIRNLSNKYPLLKKKVIGIPYCRGYMDAVNDGEVINFLLGAMDLKKDNLNYEFMSAIEKLADKIYEKGWDKNALD